MTAAEKIAQLAKQHGIVADPDDPETKFARAINRIAGIEPDETIKLIAQLWTYDVFTDDEMMEALRECWGERDALSHPPTM